VRRLAPILALIVLAAPGCGGTTLSSKDLQKQFEAIQSLAAEGALVADGAADGRTTDIFVRVHALYLSEAAAKVGDDLSAKQASSSLAPDKSDAVELAGRVEDDLTQLHESPGDKEQASRLRDDLERLAAQAERQAG
jgi:hypothetical protein